MIDVCILRFAYILLRCLGGTTQIVRPSFNSNEDIKVFYCRKVKMYLLPAFIYCGSQPHSRVASPANLTSTRFLSYLLLYFLFIFYLPRYTLPDFPSVFFPFLSCCHLTTSTIDFYIFPLFSEGRRQRIKLTISRLDGAW